jgi:hypothetical protein
LLLASLALPLAWLLMQAVHELGHVAAAWGTGGTVRAVVLHPLAISRTDVEPNPRPLVVAWGGPVVGVLLPLAVWAVAAGIKLRLAWLARFFAGFCLLANGLYIGVGSFQAIGDAGDLVRRGAPLWSLWLFGLICAPAGLGMWNGLGRHFGFGKDATPPEPAVVYCCAIGLAVVVVLELML